ncbi:uncharacterized protein LOC141695832 [Apium graveolens]|uniref:uncharacterized protein LOC141695832 n=1 Tax=Apium graveolens TaxID=4045 RepID=UPI003D7A520E
MESPKTKEGTVGLSYPMLTRSNYTAWSLRMKVFMKAQGVWDAIEPADPKATVDEKTVQVALAVIYQGVPEDILLTIAEKETAKEAWEAIKTLCMGAERVKEAKVQMLKGEFESLVMKETDQAHDFCMKLSGIVTNIRVLGEAVEESSMVRKILRGVPDKFLQISSNIEQFGDIKVMTMEEVVGRLKAHEERMRGKTENVGGQLLLTEEEWAKKTNKSAGCRKPRREKEKNRDQIPKANLAKLEDDEPTLLFTECDNKEGDMVLLNEEKVVPKHDQKGDTKADKNVWYLDLAPGKIQ